MKRLVLVFLVLLTVQCTKPGISKTQSSPADEQASSSAGIRLKLESALPVYFLRRDQIVLRITVENNSGDYIVAYREFFPERLEQSRLPLNELSFCIRKASSPCAPFLGKKVHPQYAAPDPCSLWPLGKGAFFGQSVLLSEGPFQYELTQPGFYFAKARLRTNLRSWLNTYLANNRPGGEPLRYEPDKAIEGDLESPEITFELR